MVHRIEELMIWVERTLRRLSWYWKFGYSPPRVHLTTLWNTSFFVWLNDWLNTLTEVLFMTVNVEIFFQATVNPREMELPEKQKHGFTWMPQWPKDSRLPTPQFQCGVGRPKSSTSLQRQRLVYIPKFLHWKIERTSQTEYGGPLSI